MSISIFISKIFFILLICYSQVLDVFGYRFRCFDEKPSSNVSLAVANLLFYIARLMLMGFIAIFAIYTENTGGNLLDVNIYVVIGGVLFILINSVLLIKNIHQNLIAKIIILFRIYSLDIHDLSKKLRIINLRNIDVKLTAYSFLSSYFILICCVAPINIAYLYPAYKLTAAYVGQMLGVIAGLSWYLLQEPRITKNININKRDESYLSLVVGKVMSVFFLLMTCCIFYFK